MSSLVSAFWQTRPILDEQNYPNIRNFIIKDTENYGLITLWDSDLDTDSKLNGYTMQKMFTLLRLGSLLPIST